MANLITNTNVFDFMGTQTDVRTNQANFITALITQEQHALETELRRVFEDTEFTSTKLVDGNNCEINGETIRLIGKYRDTYEITALSEEGTALTAISAYGDGNDYYFDAKTGIITKASGEWSTGFLAIVISGSYGYLKSDQTARDDIKLILTEMVAAKSGLWDIVTNTPEGSITNTRKNITKDTENRKLSHVNYYL